MLRHTVKKFLHFNRNVSKNHFNRNVSKNHFKRSVSKNHLRLTAHFSSIVSVDSMESLKNKTIIRLRNSDLIKVKLKNLKLNILPKPNLDLSEGYDFKICDLQIPIIEADPNNAYGGRVSGYYTMKKKYFAAYDVKLHETYKNYYHNYEYNYGHVFEPTDSLRPMSCEIYNIKVGESVIENTNLVKINFYKNTFTETHFNNVNFSESDFNLIKFSKCVFEKCIFDKCVMSDTNFIDCRFIDSQFKTKNFHKCYLKDNHFKNCSFFEVNFKFVHISLNTNPHSFSSCKFQNMTFYGCSDFSKNIWERNLTLEKFASYIKLDSDSKF